MKNKFKTNKKIVAMIALILIIVILYIVLFLNTSSLNLFHPDQRDQEELSLEEIHKRGGEVYYYGPDKTKVIYDPEHETPEDMEEMFKYMEEDTHGTGDISAEEYEATLSPDPTPEP